MEPVELEFYQEETEGGSIKEFNVEITNDGDELNVAVWQREQNGEWRCVDEVPLQELKDNPDGLSLGKEIEDSETGRVESEIVLSSHDIERITDAALELEEDLEIGYIDR